MASEIIHASAEGTAYVDVEDFMLILDKVIEPGMPWAKIQTQTDLSAAAVALFAPAAVDAEGHDLYPDLAAKAAVLWTRLLEHRPLPRHNEFAAFEVVNEFIERNGRRWSPDPDEIRSISDDILNGGMDEARLVTWIRERLEGT